MQTGGWIGDMILLTPGLRALRSEFPNAYMAMLVNPIVQELMERNPYLDNAIVYDKRGSQKGLRQMRFMADRLRDREFDTAVILHPNSLRSAILAFMSGIPERVGIKTGLRGLFLTTKIQRRSGIHEVDRYLDAISPLVNSKRNGKLEFWGIKPEDESFAERVLANHAGVIIGINPCTTWKSKQWLTDRFADLADLIARRFDARVVLTGGSGNVQLGSEIMKHISGLGTGHTLPILNLIGRTNLWQLGALIKRFRLYITLDSGPMHIAAALGTPTIALFGPTDPVRHRPYGEGHIVIRKSEHKPCYSRKCSELSCMSAIRIDDVMKAVETMMEIRDRE
jgi:heptosyltransferase-2